MKVVPAITFNQHLPLKTTWTPPRHPLFSLAPLKVRDWQRMINQLKSQLLLNLQVPSKKENPANWSDLTHPDGMDGLSEVVNDIAFRF